MICITCASAEGGCIFFFNHVVLVGRVWKPQGPASKHRHDLLVKFIKWRLFPLIVGYTLGSCPQCKAFLGEDFRLVSALDYTVSREGEETEGEDSDTKYSVAPATASDASEGECECEDEDEHEPDCPKNKENKVDDPWYPQRRYLCALLQHFTKENFPNVSFGKVLSFLYAWLVVEMMPSSHC